jgi:hypothetical protein
MAKKTSKPDHAPMSGTDVKSMGKDMVNMMNKDTMSMMKGKNPMDMMNTGNKKKGKK